MAARHIVVMAGRLQCAGLIRPIRLEGGLAHTHLFIPWSATSWTRHCGCKALPETRRQEVSPEGCTSQTLALFMAM